MNKKIYILYSSFYDEYGESLKIGGIQSYIIALINVFKSYNITPIVIQYAQKNFEKKYNDVDIYGIKVNSNWKQKRKNQAVFTACRKMIVIESDIVIFASDTMIVKNNLKRVIAIQHGISWDIFEERKKSKLYTFFYFFRKALYSFKIIQRLNKVNFLITVDYNFLNWYRTQVPYSTLAVSVIPNFVDMKQYTNNIKSSNTVKIIFARRFEVYRGTRIFADAIDKLLLDKNNNISVTFAGAGPEEEYLKTRFGKNTNVTFIKYLSTDSLSIHSDHHIAVIPTVGSEGTSLSLLEAMASKCAVIATNVGGMTNILLDNFNGLIINPKSSELYNAISSLIKNPKLREKLGNNAHLTVYEAFNYYNWEQKWRQVIEKAGADK